MTIAVRSFAKINLGLYIGTRRGDGFHELRTVYQTIALHDVIRVSVDRGEGIEIHCSDPRVPLDSRNTCHRIAALVMETIGVAGKVRIEIEKKLPVQGGLGAASSNAVATMFALERAVGRVRGSRTSKSARRGTAVRGGRSEMGRRLTQAERLRIAAQVGSDLSLFVVGGTVLGVGRGEEVYALADLPAMAMVVVTPEVGVSTPKAFADWDALVEQDNSALGEQRRGEMAVSTPANPLTGLRASDKLFDVGCALSAWLSSYPDAGAPTKSGGRIGSLLSDLVRAGIRNDFEEVVFSQVPELRDIKGALERAGARFASLSGSGSTLYGLFATSDAAKKAATGLSKQGMRAVATRTLTRREYWSKLLVVSR